MFIGIAATIPDLPNLPGQGGGGPEVTLDYSSSNFCADASDPTLSDASPVGGVFSYTGVGTLYLNTSNGAIDISGSDPGNYTVIYTVIGVGDSSFPINIGATIDTTMTGDSSTCIGFAPLPADLTAVSGYSNYEWFKDNVSVQNGTSNTYTPAFNVAGNFVYKVTITDSSLGIPCTATSSDFAFAVNALPTISIADATGGFCSGSSTTITTTVSAGTVFAWYKDDVLIVGQTGSTLTVNEAAEYKATVTDGNGCTSPLSDGLDIEQFDSPTVTIATVPGTTICTGDTATLTASVTGGTGTMSYLWSNSDTNPAISVAPTTTTTYTVTVTDDNGCTGTASQEITPSTNATAIASINNDAAMSFNGTDSYIQMGENLPNLSNTARTLVFWAKAADWTNLSVIIESNKFKMTVVSGYSGYMVFTTNSEVDNDQRKTWPTTSLTNNTWHHFAMTVDSSNDISNIYVDGVSESTTSVAGFNTGTVDNIGKRWNNSSYFEGELDEIAVWDSKLSSCDIKGIYEGSIGSNAGKAANLLDTNTTIPAPVYWNRMGDS
jgi:hypothetical protein